MWSEAGTNNAVNFEVPHAFNVLDYFIVTYVWAEKIKDDKGSLKAHFKFRCQKRDLMTKGWWTSAEAPARSQAPDHSMVCPERPCGTCHEDSKEIFEQGWMCLWPKCTRFWMGANGEAAPDRPTYCKAFLDERVEVDMRIEPAFSLVPSPPELDVESDPLTAFSSESSKGFCCPGCGQCSQRRLWEFWKCPNCSTIHQIPQKVVDHQAVMDREDAENFGPAHSKDHWKAPVVHLGLDVLGHWRNEVYQLADSNCVMHFQANAAINAAAGGSNELFKSLQSDPRMRLQRFALHTAGSGPIRNFRMRKLTSSQSEESSLRRPSRGTG